MTDTTNLPHSRACGINCNGHGAACSKDCPTCAGRPDWTPEQERSVSGGARATIAAHKVARLFPNETRHMEVGAPATSDQLADLLEIVAAGVVGLQQRAAAAEQREDAYREAVEGGRVLLGLVVPELVYPQRVVLGSPDDWSDERPMAPGMLHVLPDPLTLLRQEVADLTAAVGRLADQGREQPEPTACRADEFCEAPLHYIACPSYTNSAGH